VELARQDRGVPLQSREIAARQNIPQPYLDQLLVSLRRAGLVKSVRGAGGGYLLAAPADTLTVADALRPLSSELFSTRWQADSSGEPSITHVFHNALTAAVETLAAVHISDLVEEQDAQRGNQAFMMNI
jgi:Rrf2 family protein